MGCGEDGGDRIEREEAFPGCGAAAPTVPVPATPQSLLTLAIEEACRGVQAAHGGPFGALVVRPVSGAPSSGRDAEVAVLAQCHNEAMRQLDPTAHAEVVAIRTACRRLGTRKLDGCVLYTSCYPCPMCLCAILWSGIRHVYYAATSAEASRAGFDDGKFSSALQAQPQLVQLCSLQHVEHARARAPFEAYRAAVNSGRLEPY